LQLFAAGDVGGGGGGGGGSVANNDDVRTALHPTSHGRNKQDYRVSWFLCQVLHDLGVLDSNGDDDGDDDFRDELHVNYAAQLEAAGYWGDAVYVLLHLSSESAQETAVRELLRRNHLKVTAQPDTVKDFNLPSEWLDEAAALGARYAHNQEQEVASLVQAREFGQAHVVIYESVAHEHVIGVKRQDGAGDVMEWLAAIEKAHNEDGRVALWEQKGKVYLDYFRIMEKSRPFREAVASKGSLAALGGKVHGMGTETGNKHRQETKRGTAPSVEDKKELEESASDWCELHLKCVTDIDRVCDATMLREVFQLRETLQADEEEGASVSSPEGSYELAKKLSGTCSQDVNIAENYRKSQLEKWMAEMTASLGN